MIKYKYGIFISIHRKELVVSGDLCAKEELRFISLILTKHPKSAESFAHR